MTFDAVALPKHNPGYKKELIYLIPEVENALAASGFAVSDYSLKAQSYDADTDVETYERIIDANQEEDQLGLFSFATRFLLAKHLVSAVFGSFVSGALAIRFAVMQTVKRGSLFALRASIAATTTVITLLSSVAHLALSAGLSIVKGAFKLLSRHPVVAAAGAVAFSAVAYKVYEAKNKVSAQDIREKASELEELLDNTQTAESALLSMRTQSNAELARAHQEAKDRKHYKLSEAAYRAVENATNAMYKRSSDVRPTAIEFEGTNAEKLAAAKEFLKRTTHFSAESEIYETMIKEGWDKLDASSANDYSRFGINFNKNRSKEFIRNLTAEQAFNIYKKEYWDAADVDDVPDILKRMYFNTAVNMGVGAAKQILRESDGTLEGFAAARWNRYNRIVQRDPSKRKYLKGWRRRTIQEYNESLKIAKQMYDRYLKKSLEFSSIPPDAGSVQVNTQPQANDPIYVARDRKILQFDNN